MSLFTLSMTSSSFLFLQHQQYIIYDKKTERRFRGIYDPNIVHVLICTVLYLFVNVPRVFANAVIFSVTPIMALILMLIEILMFVLFCHKCSVPLNNNVVFPSGLVSALANFISVTGPFRKLGHINLISNILLMIKVILLYPIVYNETLTIDISRDPDMFRCWNKSEVMNYTYSPSHRAEKINMNITTITQQTIDLSFRPFCSPDESPNSFLFEMVLPIVLMSIAFITIPFGYVIGALMTREKLLAFDKIKKSVFKCFGKCKCAGDVEIRESDDDDIALEGLTNTCLDEKINRPPKKSSSQLSNIQKHNNDEGCCGANTMITFFDNVRTIFSQGRSSEENCKY